MKWYNHLGIGIIALPFFCVMIYALYQGLLYHTLATVMSALVTVWASVGVYLATKD